ncbi:MAG: hypothetical protein ACFCU4_04450 [Puniceicoccaceae bacterium]
MLLVDCHVHLWPIFEPPSLLEAAADCFLGSGLGPTEGVLLLTLTKGESLEAFEDRLKTQNFWQRTKEVPSQWARQSDGFLLSLIPGRQVVSRDGIEVHGFFDESVEESVVDGLPAEEICRRWLAQEVRVVLPYGVGKWTGKRGKVIGQILNENPRCMVSDSGNRWKGIPFERALHQINYRGKVLAGSDPLPLKGQLQRVGSFGIQLPQFDWSNRRSKDLLDEIFDPQKEASRYGDGAALPTFFRSQFQMQWRKRFAKR